MTCSLGPCEAFQSALEDMQMHERLLSASRTIALICGAVQIDRVAWDQRHAGMGTGCSCVAVTWRLVLMPVR